MRVRREKRKKNLTNSTDILYDVRKHKGCLDDGEWYYDSVIDYCLKKACEAALFEGHYSLVSEWNLGRVAGCDFSVLSSFLIPKAMSSKGLMQLPSHTGTGWILGGNNSLCEFLLIPINFDNTHWSLGIVWLAPSPGSSEWKRCILYLDSLSSPSSKFRKKVEEKCGGIRTYLNSRCQMSDDYTTHNLPVIHVKVPQQDNGYDCGLFVLHYAILFITCQNKRALAIDLIHGNKENWFGGGTSEGVSEYLYNLRKSVRDAILCQIADLKPLRTDESKTTVEWTISDGIMELVEEEESDEKEGSISRRKLEDNSNSKE